ncbi:MAG: DUF3892 domain-containing protein [bacterium]|nr:DUF3892 domain-containing protein [bacterium]
MKIILVATGAQGKNVIFVSDTLQVYSLEEAVRLAREKKFENVYAVQGKNGAYLRTKPSTPKKEQLEQIAISSNQLFTYANDTRNALSTPALARYVQLYQYILEKDGGPLIVTYDEKWKITKEKARIKLQPHRELIFSAAKKFKIDPYLLGAIIIDEIARFTPFEDVSENLAVFFIGKNVSAGIAQVKIETARGLIQDGYYNPNQGAPGLSVKSVGKMSRRDLYEYVKQPKHSIFFAAAKIRSVIDEWKKYLDLNEKPEIIATLYSMYKPPHAHPEANKRGLQIANEFYQLAQKWLQ